jgi:3,4-dihydroxy 2-butanone 4-phosphate synthase/GTP cyclohydrolase II
MAGTDELLAHHDEIIRRVRHEIIRRVRQHVEHAHCYQQQRELPFVTMTYAQSLDGCIARSEGETLQLSNRHSQKLTHHVRAIHDAILVGINTVVRDNPRLNVRLVEGKNPQPVIVDSRLRFPLDACLLRDPCVRPLIVAGQAACPNREEQLTAAGAHVIRIAERDDGLLDLVQLFRELKQLGLRSIMVEGGASIITSVLTSRLADQFLLTISPRFVGGLRAVKSQDGTSGDQMPRLRNMHCHWLAGDLIICGDLDRDSECRDSSGAEQRMPQVITGDCSAAARPLQANGNLEGR